MKQYTVAQCYAAIDALAPFQTAEPWDNVGLLVGSMHAPVNAVLTALDATLGVVEEARALGAQLLVTHHPLMFAPIQRLDEAEPEAALLCALVRANISLIAAHTNLDIAPGGVSAALAERLGWPVAEHNGFLCLGAFSAPESLNVLQAHVQARCGRPVIRYGNPERRVERFAICAGAGGAEVAAAAELGAQVLLTGEIKHNQALEAAARGLAILEAGHRASEICAPEVLAKHLQLSANAVQFDVRVFVSRHDPFA